MGNTRQLDSRAVMGAIALVAQTVPEEGRSPGLSLDCPLCEDTPTYLHPVDVHAEKRGSVYGSDGRFVVSILVGCEENHVLVLEVGNSRGVLSMGFRTPYAGEVISEWKNGTFDNWVLDGTVRFNERFEVGA